MVTLIAGLSVSPTLARQKWPANLAILKTRQKKELQALKLKQKYAKSSLRDPNLPKPVRMQLKHRLEREERKLRERQKDERQMLRDRERLRKFEMKQLGSE